MLLVIDEGRTYERFLPLTYSRPSFDLVVGALSNIERLKRFSNDEIKPIIRNPLLKNKDEEPSPDAIIIYPNFIINKDFIEKLNLLNKKHFVIKSKDKILAHSAFYDLKGAEEIEVDALVLEKPYDLIKYNKLQLFEDLQLLASIHEEYKIANKKIGKYPLISDGSFSLEGDVFLDTREGPIFISDGAYIQAFSRIEGPSYIGKSSLIITGSNIRRSFIGDHCVVGGEVTNSIILNYTNSRHQSYIGDSYLGEWVNIGAHTVVSNMKNTYGEISYEWLGKKEKTGMRKLGVILADHVKTSISALLFSGHSVGFSSHVLHMLNRSLPSFTMWFGLEREGYEIFLDSAIEIAKRFMESKKVQFTEKHRELFEKIFKFTSKERELFGVKKGSFRNE